MKKQGEGLKTWKLDNSAQFYPIVSTKRTQSLFRMIAVLRDEPDSGILERAINDALVRFPTFKVRLKRGYAWYYLEENPAPFRLSPCPGKILTPIDPDSNDGYLFRVCINGRRIEMEVFHAVCDGVAALEFLKAFIFRYRALCGVELPSASGAPDLFEPPSAEEEEDAFVRYYRPITLRDIDVKSLTGAPPRLLRGTLDPTGYKSSFTAVPLAAAAEAAKARGVTFTALMTGVLAYSIEKVCGGKLPIVMMVPVNLRKHFPSVTRRNFVTFVRLVFGRRQKTLDDFIGEAQRQLKAKSTEKELLKFVSTTVRSERAAILRITPVWLKIAVTRIARLFLKSRQTIIFSNLGKVEMPEEAGVERFVFNLNVSKNAKVNVAAVTLGDEVSFAFTRSIVETALEDEFFSQLGQLGIGRTAAAGEASSVPASVPRLQPN